MQTLFDLVRRSADRYGSAPALGMRRGPRTERRSYARLLADVERAAARLEQRGIGSGDRVLMLAPNSPELVVSMFAVWALGAVLVPIDLRTAGDVIEALIRQTEPRFAIAEPSDAVPSVPTLSPGSLAGRDPLPHDWLPLPASPVWDGAPDGLAEIVFTSGTTGDPKGVMLTHRNILSNVEAAVQTLSTAPGTRVLSLLPLSHMLEQTAGLLAAIATGATIYYTASRRSTAIQEALQRHRIELLVCVPEVLRLMLAGIEREVERTGRRREWRTMLELSGRLPMAARRVPMAGVRRRLGGHLGLVLCGGAPLAPELWRAWERLGVRVIQGYGATECAPIVTSHRLHRRRPGTVGWPVRGVEVRLGPEGEVLVRGPNVTAGYWRDVARTSASFRDGWYRTGDLGTLAPDGELRLHGRARDMIVLADGRNVFPEDVEAALRREPAIRDCVVVGLPRPDGSAEVHAVVVPADGAPDVEAALRRANERLGPHQQVRGYTLWTDGDLPRTPSLKVKRNAVLAALAGAPGPVLDAPALVGASTAERIVALLARQSGRPAASLNASSDLALDVGLDSLGRVELAVLLEEELGCQLSDDAIADLRTVGDLTAAVERGGEAGDAAPLAAWPRSPLARAVRAVAQHGLLFPAISAICRPFGVTATAQLAGLRGPALFVANHASHLDSPLVLASLPGRLRRRTSVAAAADYFFATRPRALLASLVLGAFPFQRRGSVGASLAHCGDLVDAGQSILIFPEGTRSTTGELAPLKSGIGLLARGLGIPVVPIYLDGPFRILPKGRTRPRPGPVRVVVGRPLRFDASASPQEATERIQAALRELRGRASPPAPAMHKSAPFRGSFCAGGVAFVQPRFMIRRSPRPSGGGS